MGSPHEKLVDGDGSQMREPALDLLSQFRCWPIDSTNFDFCALDIIFRGQFPGATLE